MLTWRLSCYDKKYLCFVSVFLQDLTGATLCSPAPRVLKHLPTDFTVDDLRAAARLSGYLSCMVALNLTKAQIEADPSFDLALTVAQVPCAAPEVDSDPPRSPYDHCCQRNIYMRPRTSDGGTYNTVIGTHGFFFL